MADGVEVTKAHEDRAARILINAYKVSVMNDPHSSDEEVFNDWEVKGLSMFMNNLVKVRAADDAYMTMINNCLNEATFNGAFKQ